MYIMSKYQRWSQYKHKYYHFPGYGIKTPEELKIIGDKRRAEKENFFEAVVPTPEHIEKVDKLNKELKELIKNNETKKDE